MRCFDISPPLSESIAVWPGDVPLTRQVALDMGNGDNLTLSSVTTTLHVGAHADAPSHYEKDGEDIASRDPMRYFGPAEVMQVTGAGEDGRIRVSDLPRPPSATRLLLRTGSFPDPTHFNKDFHSLSPELVAHVYERGVRLIGIDTPSVDPCNDAHLHSHNAIAARDMAILEGLVLSEVPEGQYLLSALPLKLEGADAAPVRAILVEATLSPMSSAT